MEYKKLIEEQIRLAKKVELKDGFDKLELLGGVDQAYVGDKIISCAVVVNADSLKLVDKACTISYPPMPYVPGFLSYREGPIIVETISKLNERPDVLFVDGNGILHPRRFGIASHVGLLLDIPTIGVAKKLLTGEVRGDTVYLDKEAVAKVLATKEHAKPIYVSPGHKVSLRTALELSRKTLTGYKLPYPLHLAHKFATKMKRKQKSLMKSED